ncbi:MAG: carboxypeptidase-like regulatory domain-containing protein [Vicinamibacterales bacterium]
MRETVGLGRWTGHAAAAVLVVGVLVVIETMALAGSNGTARIWGRVTDREGAALQGARVSLASIDTKQVVAVHSDASGLFVFDKVAPGRYRIGVRYRHVGGQSDEGLLFEPNQTYTLDLPIDVGRTSGDGRVRETRPRPAAPLAPSNGTVRRSRARPA